MAESKASESTAQYDLTNTLAKYLDLHLMFPLLEFVDGNEFLKYSPEDIQKARLALVQPTNMVEYAIEIYQELNNTKDVPADMATLRDSVYRQIETYESEDSALRTFFTDLDAGKYANTFSEQQPLNLAWLSENVGVKQEDVEEYYKCAKFEYECGQYETTTQMLTNFLQIEEYKVITSELGFKALWGKFAALILLPNEGYPNKWDMAMTELDKLKNAIDTRGDNDKQQLQQRTW
eukprot:CAMPEP_0114341788 /NCGR_PEP_ID=MMETSP0101-20121206/9286_1 /TAXON_ID=38822 ORGANISM="Pteridomonas danica, Strain PT" /NCGR_SAMPLE_ID=MMETSP0101 /ASSEMBLY_ACC=CAM_ASM_000211 /LENGTH=234 /DNA_ID=CAMNT_0001475519 /DNA_START=20 /DNA_END=721 /DNA_ORIENTATION=+